MTETQTAVHDGETAVESRGHFINGTVVPGAGEPIRRYSPATGELVAAFANGSPADVDAAVAAARTAFDTGVWSELPGLERGRVLLRFAALMREHVDELTALDADEVGNPRRVARANVLGAIDDTEFAAALAGVVHGDVHTNLGTDFTGMMVREPIGVAGLIVPWNFPTLVLCQKLSFALAAGCAAVVKPSELTSSSALLLAELATAAGVPAGVLNVVTGYGDRAGQHLAEHKDVDLVSFTGSTATGRKIMAAAQENLTRVALELGGKSAQIVFADADLDDAVEGVLFGVVHNQGECCLAGSRLLVEQRIAERFLDLLTERAAGLRLGGPHDEADLGALIHPEHLHKVLRYIETAVSEGASVRAGGHRLTGATHANGCFVAPTVLDRVTPEHRAFQEEIFGPVVTVTRFTDRDEAAELANAVEYGLGNSVWTKNIDTALLLSRRLRSGTVFINTTIDGSPQLAFGGYKASGFGREKGTTGLEEFTQLKTVQIRTGKRAGSFNLLG
ncbi:aldehyde dehydrogenase family protein [Amycolatopsis sp. A133]|uniref:aldehyde dehydrogenase family protein n=1 Tax=Amycolatopsis sp. A133 TaxID=3064472 RepID=UPI0027FBBEE1|nr:aldehyde dehydrogenase family protein [Amycolatopsis sp. A133]MDQ7803476.1 aldehyde dehydrogenase family protein [Amycolatopsis sp. A133]